MPANSQNMKASLKMIVVPVLKSMGFKGTFPHFRRVAEDKIDLLTFQFDKYGGGFIFEISSCSPSGIATYWGAHIPPNKVTAYDVVERVRLQPRDEPFTDGWFRFDNESYSAVAESVIPYILKAEALWKSRIKIEDYPSIICGL